ncbi:MAG TPA: hypothetical protein VM580_27075 [Labilithrix sp.]|jgi:hypothetical protein|nr:hypothetical protein [Labilithrix sp.]
MKRATLALLGLAALAGGITATLPSAEAQRIDPRRPAVFVVGPPPGASPMHRVDARRSGVTKSPLPSGALRVAWRKTTGLTIDQPALSGEGGLLAVVSVRGDVSFLDEAGEERAIVKVGAAQVGAAAMTSDGTVVYTTSSGDAIGVRRSIHHPRFSTRVGGERNVRAAPLALDDGGVVVATTSDLIVLDSEGNVRSRVSLPEGPAAPLLAAGDRILAVTTTGNVFAWAPGREPIRIGSFGAPVDGAAVLDDNDRLIGVVEGNHLVEIDLTRGGRTTRSIAPQGLYLGPPTVQSAAGGASTATLLALTHSRGFVVSVDAAGQELLRAPIAVVTPVMLPDGGAAPLVAPPHVGPLVDPSGTMAFAAPDSHVGVLSADGAVHMLDETLCMKGTRSGIVGLTPFGSGGFAVTCDNGTVLRIVGPNAGHVPTPPASARSAEPPKPESSPSPADDD